MTLSFLLTSLIVLAAFMPNYLTDYRKLGLETMGLVLAAMGAGACLGMVLVPAVSDRLGRKPVMVVALAVALVALWLLPTLGVDPTVLAGLLFVAAMVILTFLLMRMKIFQAIKLGETT